MRWLQAATMGRGRGSSPQSIEQEYSQKEKDHGFYAKSARKSRGVRDAMIASSISAMKKAIRYSHIHKRNE
jgi:hypothetical protein